MTKVTGQEAKSYGILLLDVDRTLLDFDQSERMGISQVLAHYGFSAKEEFLRRYQQINEQFWQAFGRGEITKQELSTRRFTVFFETLGKAAEGEEAERLYRQFLDGSAILLPGALETCEYLANRYDCYVVTNGTSDTQYRRLALSGLDRFMKEVFVSEDAGSQKPQQAYFDYCFSKIFPEKEKVGEEEKRQMLLVGDSISSDILGGNLAGVDTCWVNPGKLPVPEGVHVEYEIRQISELMEFL